MYPPTDFPRAIGSFPFPIPVPTADPDAGTQWCVMFNEDYLPAVLGALFQLTLQATWETTDPAVNLLAQNRAMSLISLFQVGAECMTSLMFGTCDPPDCGIKYSTDGGVTWTCLDISTCIASLADTQIQNAITTGLVKKGQTQTPPQTPPPPTQCYTYHVKLQPGEKWHSPFPINDGWLISVTNPVGGWSIGEVEWYCPDGARYLLGTCDEALHSHVTGDLLATAWHMALIGHVGAVYFDPLTSSYTIPSGTGLSDFFIQANTALTASPSGMVEFDVQICNTGWQHTFDFSLGGLGWTKWGALTRSIRMPDGKACPVVATSPVQSASTSASTRTLPVSGISGTVELQRAQAVVGLQPISARFVRKGQIAQVPSTIPNYSTSRTRPISA